MAKRQPKHGLVEAFCRGLPQKGQVKSVALKRPTVTDNLVPRKLPNGCQIVSTGESGELRELLRESMFGAMSANSGRG